MPRGVTPEGELILGGGSDTTAVILGAGLGAERVEIYTDVDGIMTADPRLVEDARIISHLTYNEVCQLAYEGAKVVHPRAVEVAMQHNVEVVVKRLQDSEAGTVISSEASFTGEPHYAPKVSRVITGYPPARFGQVIIEMGADDAETELLMLDRLGEAKISST